MNESIRLLLVDDNPDDRALVIRELRRQFSDAHVDEVTDQREFESALTSARPDLVITDYQLLWLDGLRVLRRVKAQWPDCPVVMFTGTGSEEIAVEAMKAGLDDYVLKSPKHYARLPTAARLALRLARHRIELKEAEHRYATLFNTVPVGLFRARDDGTILDANSAFAEMLGYADVRGLQGVNFAGLFADRSEYDTWRQLINANGLVHNFETRLRCSDGRLCWVQSSATSLRNPATQEVEFEGSLEDVSERKAAEQEREALISELQDALAKVKTLGGLLPICSSCKKIRDDNGYWNQIETYIQGHSDAEFTHSFCPECMKQLYPEVFQETARTC